MCGIAGVVVVGASALGEVADALSESIISRGPDDSGWLAYSHGHVEFGRGNFPRTPTTVALLHRRLSIIDLSDSAAQPMASSNGSLHVVFNGEIYNYLELREELRTLGYAFKTQSDTEVLLAAYEEWGSGAFARFTGMFAVAILDRNRSTVILARDHFGIKPLYFARWRGGIAFASQITTLLELPGLRRTAREERVVEYLLTGLTDHGRETLLEDVMQVEPGTIMEVPIGCPQKFAVERYWSPVALPNSSNDIAKSSRELRALFMESIRFHLRSDVPIGAALSGGIDSSAIVCAMRSVAGNNLQLETFSYVEDGSPHSEEHWADLVANSAKAHSNKVRINTESLAEDLTKLIRAQGEPFGSTSVYAQYAVFKAARKRGITVMLDGQGADELLAGYRHYYRARINSMVNTRVWGALLTLIRAIRRDRAVPLWTLIGWVVLAQIPSLRAPVQRWRRRKVPKWLKQRPSGPWLEALDVDAAADLKSTLIRSITSTHLPHLLRYEDRNSMASSIESRVPFLTPKIADFILSLPEDFLIAPDGTRKSIFRMAMRGIVPDAILDRRDKIGFQTPEETWLLEHIEEIRLAFSGAPENSVVDRDGLAELITLFRDNPSKYRQEVWRCYNLFLWVAAFKIELPIDAAPPEHRRV